MKVRRLPIDRGVSGWDAILPAKAPARLLQEQITADWLIIGGGFAGLAAAERLQAARPGDRIVLLDAVRVGEGPAGRNSGFMIDLPHRLTSDNYSGGAAQDQGEIAVHRAAIEFALNAAERHGLPKEAIIRSGKINAAATEKGLAHNRDYGAHLKGLGEAHEHLDAAAMRDLTGSDYYLGGLFTPGTAMLQPAAYVRGLAAGLGAAGAAVFENTPVTSLTKQGPDWVARTPQGAVTAPKVVMAVNGHIESFGHYKRRLVHVILYASMTRALDPVEISALGGQAQWGLTPADPMGSTVRRVGGTSGTRIVVRNRTSYAPNMEASGARISSAAGSHDRSLRSRFPALADVGFEYSWAGRLCLSLNDAPAFGEIDAGLFSACCQNGLGAAKGTLAGIAAADLALGADNDLTRHFSNAEPPKRLPPEPIAAIGAGLQIWWGEKSAGREL